MQVNEIYRPAVILAKSTESLAELIANNINESSLIESVRMSESLLRKLWQREFFRAVNTVSGANIDEYEEEFVEATKVPAVRKFLVSQIKAPADEELKSFYRALLSLANDAISLAHPLLFVL